MPARPVTFATVKKIALTLPEVEASTTHGSPALKYKGKRLLAWIPAHKWLEKGTFAVMIDEGQKEALIADAPDTYYTHPHYDNYPCVLVRMSRVTPDALHDLLNASWQFVSRYNSHKRS
jgi:hypothetical protein